MSKPVYPRRVEFDIQQVHKGVNKMRRRPLTGVWHTPLEASDPDQATIETLWPADSPIDPPPALNDADGWEQVDGNRFSYRWHTDGSFETKGYLTPGTSGTEVIVFPESFMAGLDDTVTAIIDLKSGSTFTFGRGEIDTATGILVITYPAT